MTLSIIAAIGRHNEIGKDNTMLAHLPADLRHFKQTTQNHTVIMGRKTFESLPKGALPNRRNIVISRNPDFRCQGVETVASLDHALLKCLDEIEVFVIGGGTIYAQALPSADRLYLTHIQASFPEAEIFFPEIDYNQWQVVESELYQADDKNPFDMIFKQYERRG